jgi:hypothetical protein
MTALTLVMGFYEFVRKGQKYDGKSDASTSLGGRLIKAHDKHAPCAVVGLLTNSLWLKTVHDTPKSVTKNKMTNQTKQQGSGRNHKHNLLTVRRNF